MERKRTSVPYIEHLGDDVTIISLLFFSGKEVWKHMATINQNKAQNPMSEYLLKIQSIINNTEFMNKTEALKYETMETKEAGSAYVRAMTKTDVFESYTYDGRVVYTMLEAAGIKEEQIFYFIENPQMIPHVIKEKLLDQARQNLIASYVERNKYYVMLTGKPFGGNELYPPDEELLIPDEFYDIYKDDHVISRNQPIHEMPLKYQELFMNSEFYKRMINEHPDSKYLLYIGSNSIPIHVSRSARDGDILRINTNKLATYSPVFGNISVSADIVHGYVNAYKETRDYVYNTLRGDFSNIYPNYDSFVRFLTIYMSIGNALNNFMKKSSSMIYMNNVTANNFFMLYGLPSVIMEGASMIEFLKKFRMILMDKGTNIVYRVKDLIGYEYTDIYTLVMVKQQVFENGIPIYYYDDEGNKYPKQEIVFRRLGTTDDNTSYFKFRESTTEYTVDEITSGDPRWWNTPEVEQMLQDMNYTLSNSKYIQLSTHLSMTDIWWQCVILLRGLLDRKTETQYTMLNINFNINGTSEISVFEAVLVLVILMNWHMVDYAGNHLAGNMYLPNSLYNSKAVCLDMLFGGLNIAMKFTKGIQYKRGDLVGLTVDDLYEVTQDFVASNNPHVDTEQAFGFAISAGNIIKTNIVDGTQKAPIVGLPYKITSFNFNVREENREFYESIKSMDYIEPDVFLPMLDAVLDRKDMNLGEVLMTDVRLIYKYLENKLRSTITIGEFRQVTDVFSNLFLVDPVRNWYDDNTTFDVDNVLIEEYGITSNDLASLKSFFKETSEPQLIVSYNNEEYPIRLYHVLNNNATNVEIRGTYVFRDRGFVSAFVSEMQKFVSPDLLSSAISSNIKNSYQDIIVDKVILDTSNTAEGPKTFESLLFRTNASLYKYMTSMQSNGENMLLLMRSIVKALETYTNSQLSGLEFNAIGVNNYFHILKEVISYFKSYMVEFTKDEFVYIFDGLFDNGGHSNMLRLYDEISNVTVNMLPKDSLTMYDVSHADVCLKMEDDNKGFMCDEAMFHVCGTYQSLIDSGYDIWYDDGKTITQEPNMSISPDTYVTANIVTDEDQSSSSSAYKIIININNIDVIPPNYYGNVR